VTGPPRPAADRLPSPSPPRLRRLLIGALAAGASVVVVAGCGSGGAPRFGMPDPATRAEHSTLHLWQGVFITAMVVGALVWGLIIWSIVRYRKKPGDEELPVQTRYHLPLEITYTVIPIIIVAVIFFFVVRVENRVDRTVSDPDVTVRVEGFQWGWRFTYLAPDGSTIGVPIVGNQYQNPTLTLPARETVQLILVSDDVDHSFYVPDFLFKRDLIPGVNNKVDLYIEHTGLFQGHCAEFCGLHHADMNFRVNAVDRSRFQPQLASASGGNP
jgi:cytochrome c oxidase subunit 2